MKQVTLAERLALSAMREASEPELDMRFRLSARAHSHEQSIGVGSGSAEGGGLCLRDMLAASEMESVIWLPTQFYKLVLQLSDAD